MQGKRSLLQLAVVVCLLAGVLCAPAWAVPDLQIYIPGATYDTATETWVTNAGSFDLQIIAANQSLLGVMFSAALPQGVDPSSGTLTVAADLLDGWSNGTPVRGDGTSLPPHGIFPTQFEVFDAGDFDPLTQNVYNMVDGGGPALGLIKTFHVDVTGFQSVHFDAYNHTVNADKHADYRFAPFSHDGEGGNVPEPGTIGLLAVGMLGMLPFWRLRKRA